MKVKIAVGWTPYEPETIYGIYTEDTSDEAILEKHSDESFHENLDIEIYDVKTID